MISVGHHSLSGRAIRLIIWSTEFESEIDLFLFNIKLFYKFSKSQNNAHVTFGSISTAIIIILHIIITLLLLSFIFIAHFTRACEILFLYFHFLYFNQTCTNVSPMYTVQFKQSSGLNKYINVLERNFYAAGQKLP